MTIIVQHYFDSQLQSEMPSAQRDLIELFEWTVASAASRTAPAAQDIPIATSKYSYLIHSLKKQTDDDGYDKYPARRTNFKMMN